ncbi:uncharacterized protein N0V89_010530 [Didymosphaeria variabile]|uniref:FAD/NAD(P)-binding domain-containing protein n=1 Tax=Didymosphaeria variabile TaxID=1932322 RepID=A0A9W8XBG2_9PLEO|nr:uncharacterized protein N0V89_010530 [Didymosphaeria variabile]KAJ4346599.1 hypothetical protein N0V89_010530 [Didymosphaeria variabile]
MSTYLHYDALILGSGQAGTPLASHLRSLNLSVCLVERAHIGGCCVNEGCTPTKTMVASGRMAYLVRRATEYGVHDGEGTPRITVAMQEVRERKKDIVDSFRGGGEKRLEAAGVVVEAGRRGSWGEERGGLRWGRGKKVVTAERVFVNVGCRPARPEVPGLDDIPLERVLDSTSIQELGEVPGHLVVVGGGYIGLEFAQLFRRLGADVSIIHRGPGLLSRNDDPELVQCMQRILEEDGIDIIFSATSTTFSNSPSSSAEEAHDLPIRVTTLSAGEKKDFHASHILLATGRVPNTSTLNLSSAGISTTSSGYIPTSPSLQTNIPGIYAMGDVKGGPAFTHVSYDDFRILKAHLAGETARTTEDRTGLVPSVVYTDPQFAHIGPKWGELPKGRGLVSYSMLKAVIDPSTNKIISFSAIAVEAGEIMAVVQMAMVGGLTWMAVRDAVFAHPSWAECLNNLWGGERKEI